MLSSSIFGYKDYKKFILDWIEQAPNGGRGLRSKLADAMGCQTAFVTHVLSGDSHLSLEQAEGAAKWMGLSDSEVDFFLNLILLKRSGTKSLEKHFEKQLSVKREAQAVLKDRIKIKDTLSTEDQQTYYSNWIYAAIHMALMINQLQTIEGLQKYFQIPIQRIMSVLDFLTNTGLIKQEKGYFKVNRPVLHLGVNSPLLYQHHTQWRLKAIDTISVKGPENLHYSGVISLSQEDYEWVREKLSHLLEQIVAKVKDSKDEKLATLCFDWFEL